MEDFCANFYEEYDKKYQKLLSTKVKQENKQFFHFFSGDLESYDKNSSTHAWISFSLPKERIFKRRLMTFLVCGWSIKSLSNYYIYAHWYL